MPSGILSQEHFYRVRKMCKDYIDFCQRLSNEKENFGKDLTERLSCQLRPPWELPPGAASVEQLVCICPPEERRPCSTGVLALLTRGKTHFLLLSAVLESTAPRHFPAMLPVLAFGFSYHPCMFFWLMLSYSYIINLVNYA